MPGSCRQVYGVYGDPIIICPKPHSIYLRGTIRILGSRVEGRGARGLARPAVGFRGLEFRV